MRSNEDGSEDRLSNLPDDVIVHILSFLYTKPAVRSCVLSKRWIDLWKGIPTLILHDSTFKYVTNFVKCITKVLEIHVNSGELRKFELLCQGKIGRRAVFEKILQYVESQKSSIKEIGIFVAADGDLLMNSISQCQNLTSLRLSLNPEGRPTLFPKSLDLPSLTSLKLENFAFRCGASDIAEPFFPFTKLNSLVLDRCNLVGTKNLRISSATLDNLGMHKNSCDFGKLELSAPSLRRFAFTCGRGFPEIDETALSSIKQASILYSLHSSSAMDHGSVLFSWLKGLANVESLTLNSISLQILSLVPGLFEVKLPSMGNLKSLEVKLDSLGQGGPLLQSIKDAMLTKAAAKSSKEVDELRKAFEAGSKPPTIPDGIVNYLRQNSQFAKVNVRPNWPDMYFKQNKETKIEREVIEYNMQFATPSTFAESAAPTSIAESASYLCPAEKDDKSSNEDKVEKHQLNTDLSLPDNEQ